MGSRVCAFERSWRFSLLHNRETSLRIWGICLVETLKAKPLKMPHTLELWLTNIFYREPSSKYFRLCELHAILVYSSFCSSIVFLLIILLKCKKNYFWFTDSTKIGHRLDLVHKPKFAGSYQE